MTGQEKEQMALDIVMELRTAKQSTRDAWRRQSLAAFPDDREFIEQAYKMACQ